MKIAELVPEIALVESRTISRLERRAARSPRASGQACSSEIDFIRAVLADANVERVAHMVAGQHQCSHRIQKRR